MSPEDMVPSPDSCSADVAAYSLGALDWVEAEAFERHLRTCAVCPVELSAFRQVVDEIATSVPPCTAPRSVKRRVMAAVETDSRRAPARRAPRRRFSLPVSGPAIAFGSAAAFACAAIIVAVIALPGRMGNRTIDAAVTGSSGSASLVINSGHAQLDLNHIAAPPKGQIYEVWVQRGTKTPEPAKATLFSVDRRGDATVSVAGSLYGISHVLVTAEPAGGTRRPTHSAVVSAAL